MSSWLIAGVGLVYAGIAVNEFIWGKPGLGIAFAGYALANIGLYMEALR